MVVGHTRKKCECVFQPTIHNAHMYRRLRPFPNKRERVERQL